MSMNAAILMLDNQDSFTYNLVDELRKAGHNVTIFRNTVAPEVILAALDTLGDNALLLLSPGPGTPATAGHLMALLERASGSLPVLGICLGHQAIGQFHGARVTRVHTVVHGKASLLSFAPHPIFANLAGGVPVARYHSLMITDLPPSLELLAQADGIPMAVYHRGTQMLGLQFHPESILSPKGSQILQQSIQFLLQETR